MPDVEFEISARDKSGGTVRSAADGLEKLGTEATQAKRKLDDLGDETGQLARKMLEARLAASALAREFNKTGDSKILKEFEKINREAAKLGRVAKTLKFDAPDLKGGKDADGFLGKLVKFGKDAGLIAGDATIKTFGEAFSALPGSVKTGLVAGLIGTAAIAAPVIAGVVEGAVVSGIAAGGIGVGIILAAKDPRVVQEYTNLAHRIKLKLDDGFTKPFVADLLGAAPKFSDAFDAEEPRLRRIADNLSPAVQSLITSAVASVHAIMPSIEKASAVGGQIIMSFSRQLPALVGSVGKLIDAFTEGGPGAADAINLIIGSLEAMFVMLAEAGRETAPLLNFLGKLGEISHLIPDTHGKVSALTTLAEASGMSAVQAATQYEVLAQSLGNTANQARALDDAFNSLFGEMMSVDQANLAVNQGILNLKASIKENGTALDQTTQKGLNNVGMIQQQIVALDQKRQADIRAGNGTAEATAQANAAYASNVASLRTLLISLGFAASAVDALIGKYAAIPRSISTTISTVYRTQGTPPGMSDEKTGHSRTGTNDYAGVSGWAPAQFNARGGVTLAAGQAPGGGGAPTMPPMQVHTENSFTVLLDGTPFHAYSIRTTRAAEERQAWRNKVGKR